MHTQAKCLSTLVNQSLTGENQLYNYFTWIVFGLWLMGTFFWLYRVNRALSLFDGLFIIPVLQVCCAVRGHVRWGGVWKNVVCCAVLWWYVVCVC